MTPLRIALGGLVALAVAMGIGRFAFTPILPMMLRDGVVDLPRASGLASMNYVGYLVGALLCAFAPRLRRWLPSRSDVDGTTWVRAGLVATALLTLAMALPWPAAWPALRFLAGVASAYVLVYSSGWCMGRLAARGRPELGGVMYAGPGAGIVVSGLVAGGLVSWQWHASAAWAVFALLAGVLTAAVWRVFGRGTEPAARAVVATAGASSMPPAAPPARAHGGAEVALLAIGYGMAGFGYIITATFLPVIARSAIAGSPFIDLFWPIFGAGVVAGALLASRLRSAIDRRWLLAIAIFVQAIAIAIGVASPTALGFAAGSLLLGLPFTTLTFFTIQEVRRIRPHEAPSTIGLVTASYGVGQIAGPPMVAALLQRGGDVHAAFQQSLVIAACALVFGGLLFVASARIWPAAASETRG